MNKKMKIAEAKRKFREEDKGKEATVARRKLRMKLRRMMSIGITEEATVIYPIELETNDFTGFLFLYGIYHEETNYYNILHFEDDSLSNRSKRNKIRLRLELGSRYPKLRLLGTIVNKDKETTRIVILDSEVEQRCLLSGVRENGKLKFETSKFRDKKCVSQAYSNTLDIFSRNTSILETSLMLEKCVIISGCGSVGSLIALELARSGLGNFILIDNDILSYHNLCRHQCGIEDVGRYKVDAVRDKILRINPNANVTISRTIIETTPKEVFEEYKKDKSIIVGCADNREGDLYANQISKIFKIPLVSIGLWERAFAGEIFYTIDNKMPCYKCFCDAIKSSGDVSQRTNQNRRIYTTEKDLTQLNFEPGISVDISFVTTIAIKLIIDILNRSEDNYTLRVLNDLTQFTLICNTNNSKVGGEMAEIFDHPLQVTRSIEVGFRGDCLKENCCTL